MTSEQLEKVKLAMEEDVVKLNFEIEQSKEKVGISEEDTPIHTFLQSPVPPSPTSVPHLEEMIEEIGVLLERRKKE